MGEFLSISNVVWRAEILQEADAAFETVGGLEFDADQPLVIEWGNKSKEEVICGATATLKIISPGDRTYEDLYSIDVGRVRLDVYRNNALYWRGCIDTEFYEEPYEQLNGYTVSLTFSDFGILDRLKWQGTGLMTLKQVWEMAMDAAGLPFSYYYELDQSRISTLKPNGKVALSLKDLMVRADNFFDEDGEASTLAEVIEGILQPLALRMVQRGGKVWIYDLNGLWQAADDSVVEWNGDSQTLSTDAVYNNVRITWSPYCQSGNLFPTTCWKEDIPTDANLYNLDTKEGKTSADGRATYFSARSTNSTSKWETSGITEVPGFTLWCSREGEGCELLDERLAFFRIVPQEDGEDAQGVMLHHRFVTIKASVNEACATGRGLVVTDVFSKDAFRQPARPILRFNSVWLPHVNNVDPTKVVGSDAMHLRVCMEMLMDVRHNPFIDASNLKLKWYFEQDGSITDIMSSLNQKSTAESYKEYLNLIYVPVRIIFETEDVGCYVWDCSSLLDSTQATPYNQSFGSWRYLRSSAPDENGCVTPSGYLCYCNPKDMDTDTGMQGWKKNVPMRAPYWDVGAPYSPRSQAWMQKVDDGQRITYPNFGKHGGRLYIEVLGSGWAAAQGKEEGEKERTYFFFAGGPTSGNENIFWLLFKLPEIEVLGSGLYENSTDSDDVEYAAELNPAAQEALELETICGTKAGGIPMARGAYYRTDTGEQLVSITRAGRTGQVEDLLIGTLYSQYAQRHTTLSGNAWILPPNLTTYSDAALPGVRLLLTEELQDLRADTSEVVLTELSPDEYTRDDETT